MVGIDGKQLPHEPQTVKWVTAVPESITLHRRKDLEKHNLNPALQNFYRPKSTKSGLYNQQAIHEGIQANVTFSPTGILNIGVTKQRIWSNTYKTLREIKDENVKNMQLKDVAPTPMRWSTFENELYKALETKN